MPVSAREQAERAGAAGGEQVPDAVADHDRILNVDPETIGCGQEQVRIRLGVLDLIAGYDRHGGRIDAERREHGAGRLEAAAGGDRPRRADPGERRQQLQAPGNGRISPTWGRNASV
jgi:hypothetical protein